MTAGLLKQNTIKVKLTRLFQHLPSVIAPLFILFSCSNDIHEVQEITRKPGTIPGEIVKEMDVLYTDSGMVRMHMKAPLMKHYNLNEKDPYEVFPHGIYVEFFNESGEVRSILKADSAIRFDLTKKMEAWGHVEAKNEKNDRLYTHHLIWDEVSRKIKSTHNVKIVANKDTLYGKGMEANEDFSEWEILKPIGKSVELNNDSTKAQ